MTRTAGPRMAETATKGHCAYLWTTIYAILLRGRSEALTALCKLSCKRSVPSRCSTTM